MPNSPREGNKETQDVVDNRNICIDHRDKRTERPDQPDSKPRREVGIANTLLGEKPGSGEKYEKRQE